jgi:methylenetetrahydrofolate dehydrogenase (NADP+)/methenyltetrahydrofolate cyclohydrolase
MALVLRGKELADKITEQVKADVAALAAAGVKPTLGIVRLGERPDDISYEKGATKRSALCDLAVKNYVLPADTSESQLLAKINEINNDDSVHGVLLLRPLPKHINSEKICAALSPAKDIDGITPGSLAGVFTGTKTGFAPCTAESCVALLDHYKIELSGKRATVVGRSLVIGRPVAMLLMHRNATVTICHTKTQNLAAVIKEADIVIAAAGVAESIGADSLRAGQAVVDVGIHVRADGSLCGDVNAQAAQDVVDAITPVPGGVGSVTTCIVMQHTVEAAKRIHLHTN